MDASSVRAMKMTRPRSFVVDHWARAARVVGEMRQQVWGGSEVGSLVSSAFSLTVSSASPRWSSVSASSTYSSSSSGTYSFVTFSASLATGGDSRPGIS